VPEDPISPKKKLNLILALLMGVFGGVGLCFVFEYFDNSIKSPEDLEEKAGIPSLGIIPYFHPDAKKRKKYGYYAPYRYHEDGQEENVEDMPDTLEVELINHKYPKLSISEDYRTIRTSILLGQAGMSPQSIMVSSALPKEGKSTTVANLAVSFAQLEKIVLVVDADLRKPRIHKIFDMPNDRGLSSYLTGFDSLENVVRDSSVKNICVLPAGPIPPNPSEILNSRKMSDLIEKLKSGFDVILFDTPPILTVIDGVILSSKSDAVLFVVKAGETNSKHFLDAVESIRRVKGSVKGAVFNQMDLNKDGYNYKAYFSYYDNED